jgi:hypothetical protein
MPIDHPFGPACICYECLRWCDGIAVITAITPAEILKRSGMDQAPAHEMSESATPQRRKGPFSHLDESEHGEAVRAYWTSYSEPERRAVGLVFIAAVVAPDGEDLVRSAYGLPELPPPPPPPWCSRCCGSLTRRTERWCGRCASYDRGPTPGSPTPKKIGLDNCNCAEYDDTILSSVPGVNSGE